LSKLEISKSGKAFIIERSGEIVASSIPDTRFINYDGRLLQATDSSQPLIIKSTAQHLREKFGSLDRIDGKQPLSSFSFDGSNQLVNVARLQDDWGLDWLIVVVIPQADFMDEFNSAALFTLFVGLAVAGVAAFLGLIAAQRIIQPIFTITDAAAAIEAGRFELKSLEAVTKRDDELGKLARIFQHMAVEIYDREQQLKQQVQELDQEIGKFKNDKQVVGLNETSYFVDLLQKARNLRTQTKERGR
jgi:methyl-accepting chemotaxis protein